MKKIICVILLMALILSSSVMAYASSSNDAEIVREETYKIDEGTVFSIETVRLNGMTGYYWHVDSNSANTAACAFIYLKLFAEAYTSSLHLVVASCGNDMAYYSNGITGGTAVVDGVPDWVNNALISASDEEVDQVKNNFENKINEYLGNVSEEQPEKEDKYGLGVIGYDPGQYKVGFDIPAGEYVLLATDGSGYFSVTSDANGNDIVFNDNFDVSSIVTVLDGEYITLKRCAAFPSSEFYEKKTINVKPGTMLKVGYDIQPGEYRLVANDGDRGYYCIYASSRQDDIISNDNFEQSTYITLTEGQYLVLSRCTVG